MPSEVQALVEKVVERLRERGETVAFAESCTGGLVSSMFTALPGVSDVFVGSIVAYSNSVKMDLLDVPQSLLKVVGAVSLPVAKRMAHGVRTRLRTTWSLSITGIAGPGGGSVGKPVGTVCFGLSGPTLEVVDQQLFGGDRRAIQKASAEYALTMLLKELGAAEGRKKKKRKND